MRNIDNSMNADYPEKIIFKKSCENKHISFINDELILINLLLAKKWIAFFRVGFQKSFGLGSKS